MVICIKNLYTLSTQRKISKKQNAVQYIYIAMQSIHSANTHRVFYH